MFDNRYEHFDFETTARYAKSFKRSLWSKFLDWLVG